MTLPVPESVRRRWLQVGLLILIVGLGAVSLLRRAPESRKDALYRLVWERCRDLADASPPEVHAQDICRSLERSLGAGDSADLVALFPMTASVGSIRDEWFRQMQPLDPDWAFLSGLSEGPDLTQYDARSRDRRTLLDALALRSLRACPPSSSVDIDRTLLERLLERRLICWDPSASGIAEPEAAFWGINAGLTLLLRSDPPAAADLDLFARRLRGIPEVIRQVRDAIRDPDPVLIDFALEEADRIVEWLRDTPDLAQAASPELRQSLSGAVAQAVAAVESYCQYLEALPVTAEASSHTGNATLVAFDLKRSEFWTGSLKDAAVAIHEQIGRSWTLHLEAGGDDADPGQVDPIPFDRFLEECRDAVKEAESFTRSHGVADIPPSEPLLLRITPPPLRTWFPLAGYVSRPLSTRDAGVYVVTPPEHGDLVEIPWRREDTILQALHETFPGHHLHAISSRTTASAVRRLYGSSWTVEGWATYVEEVWLESSPGLSRGFHARFWKDRNFQAWRSLAELAFAAGAISREEIVEFLSICLDYGPEVAGNVVDQMEVWPLRTMAYVLGQAELWSLRRDLERREGATFVLKTFHERVLKSGGTPIPLLRKELGY